MRIFVIAKPRAKQEKVEKIDPPSPRGFGRASDIHFAVAVKEPPVQGRANEAICRILARYFKIPVSEVKIISGAASKHKIIEVGLR